MAKKKKRILPKTIRKRLKAFAAAVAHEARANFMLGYDQDDHNRVHDERDAAERELIDEIHLRLEGAKYRAREDRILRYRALLECHADLSTSPTASRFTRCCELLLLALIYDVAGKQHHDIRNEFSQYFELLVGLELSVRKTPELLMQSLPALREAYLKILAFVH